VRSPEIDMSPDAVTLAEQVAKQLLSQLATAQSEGGRPHVGLTGGTIANAMYAEVAKRGPSSAVDWNQVVLWWGDERFVSQASPDRNVGQAHRAFLDVLPIPVANVHPMPSTETADTPDRGAEIYSDQLRQEGVGEFEVVLLGVGPDGHVASLFPGFPQLEMDRAIALGVTESPKPPPERITLTLAALNRAKHVWLLASGAEKSWAVATAHAQSLADSSPADGDPSLPAARVHGRLSTVWFLDRAAASGLD
jgi:6-phosphogluconolactonase